MTTKTLGPSRGITINKNTDGYKRRRKGLRLSIGNFPSGSQEEEEEEGDDTRRDAIGKQEEPLGAISSFSTLSFHRWFC